MTTIYTSKKTGVAYTMESTEIVDGKTKFTLYSEQEQDRVTTTESVLKRWYKKEIVVDFTAAEEKPDVEAEPEQEMLPMPEENTAEDEQEATTEETKEEKVMDKNQIKVSKKTKKQGNPKAKTYEEQKWGLGHTRMSIDAFCNLLDLSSVEYDEKSALILLQVGADTVATRRAWENPITGSVWFRYKNYEYELTDMAYVSGVELETA